LHKITAYIDINIDIERDHETAVVVPSTLGAHTQAETLDELQKNLKEAVELCLEEMDLETKKQLPDFVGIQQLTI
jgi:predicted RNase H-like HicB family nuclease